MIDNTFANPYLVQSTAFGADLVVHSATKYIGGHSDVTSGVLVGSSKLIQRAKEIVVGFVASLSPFEAWLTCRGIKTLAIRMEKQCDNAKQVANFLKQHPAVGEVYYPNPEATTFFHRNKQLADESKIYQFYRSLAWVDQSTVVDSNIRNEYRYTVYLIYDYDIQKLKHVHFVPTADRTSDADRQQWEQNNDRNLQACNLLPDRRGYKSVVPYK